MMRGIETPTTLVTTKFQKQARLLGRFSNKLSNRGEGGGRGTVTAGNQNCVQFRDQRANLGLVKRCVVPRLDFA